MLGRSRPFFAGIFWAISLSTNLVIADVPETWIEDAFLQDVQPIDSKLTFAVGEHGAIWKSEDAGKKWLRLNCGLDVTLKSVCFLTDQIGWIAGHDANPYSSVDGGILLHTQDGGKSWKQLCRNTLPPLNSVKFFDLDQGIVVGEPTSLSPSGIFKTEDGGKTWQGVQGDTQSPWKTSCFYAFDRGVVAGANGRVSLLEDDHLFASKLPPRGLRSVRSIRLTSNNVGWMTGDGGLVLTTSNGGVVWQSPETELPDYLRTGMDFRTVEVRGEKVWLAGSPGSVIWHSPDAGQHWSKQTTNQPLPLSTIRFSTDQIGLAVGALGVILRTENGGETWKAVRGDGRRIAFLSLHARATQTSAPLIAKLSGESGYRSAVWIAQREDIGPLTFAKDGESRLQSAIQKVGGHAGEIHWQLPITVPGVEYSSHQLTAEWQRQTEGRLPQSMLDALVRQIRIWRPNVVFIDQPAKDDAASQILFDAVQQAIEQSSQPKQFEEQIEQLGISAWKVNRVYMRLAPGAVGDATIVLDEFLPYLKSSARVASSSSVALLETGRAGLSESAAATRISYRLLGSHNDASSEKPAVGRNATAGSTSDFFNALSITPGSAARRQMFPVDDKQLERTQKVLQKHRNFIAISQKALDDPHIAGQIQAQLHSAIDGMEPQQAAGLIRDLADEYRRRSNFEMVESTYLELIRLFPQEPAALEAMKWLIQFSCSAETKWQRRRTLKWDKSNSQSQVLEIAKQLETTSPNLFRSTEIQFPLAVLRRSKGSVQAASAIIRQVASYSVDEETKKLAEREIWASFQTDESPTAFAVCRHTSIRPNLDGIFGDPCWQDAQEVRLTDSPAPPKSSKRPIDRTSATTMLTYDDEYLYVAVNAPRVANTSPDGPQLAGRQHDADLSRHDRITIRLDLDRDYVTWYEFQIDQRGWTSESCWEDHRWNPQWFVAADADRDEWRTEVAIPWKELTATPPKPGTILGLYVLRTIPAIGLQSWTQPATIRPQSAAFGLLKFE